MKGPETPWLAWVWHEFLPKKILIMVWKAWNNSLSVDDRLRRIGIPVVSKYDHCHGGGCKDINHVLYAGDFARQLWRKCAQHLGIPSQESITWKENMQLWFQRASQTSQMGVSCGDLPSIVTLRLWLRRCQVRMEEHAETIEDVWQAVKYRLSRMMKVSSNFESLQVVIWKL